MDAKGGVTISAGAVGKLHPKKAAAVAKHPMAATEGQHLDKRQRVVLAALAGKVKCSGCGKADPGHSGSLAVGPAAAPVHSIKVTRYIGFDTPNLKVDLICTNCTHYGLYEFDGNPLMDAGIVPRPAMTA